MTEYMTTVNGHAYRYLAPRPDSNYRQFFYKDRKIRAEVLYRQVVGVEPRTPEQVAKDYDIPLEAVLEAVHYCEHNEDVCREDREREEMNIRKYGYDKPPYVPHDFTQARDD